jgi:arogenate dehydrogenase (NADP+)
VGTRRAGGGIIHGVTVGIYGLGRFGTLWAELLAPYFGVVAYSRDPARPCPPGVRRGEEADVARCDALFLCVAISAMQEVCDRLRGLLDRRTVVLDTCSVKVHPAGVMVRSLPRFTPIVATHPMFGPDSVRQGLSGLPIVVCPVRSETSVVEGWSASFRSMGLEVLVMSPEEHDRGAAYTQGVTHFVGRVLADMRLERSPMSTLGYRRLLEIIEQTCNDSWELFQDLQRFNPYTAQMRARLKDSIDTVLRRLEP